MSVEIERKKTATQTESTRTLRSLIDDFDRQGASPALISFRANTSDTISYGSLLQSIKQMAAGFAERGLKQGQSVVMFAPNSPAWIICALSVIYFGGVTVPMDSQQSDEVLKHIVEDSKAQFVCTNAKGAKRLEGVFKGKGPKVILLDSPDDDKHWRKMLAPALPPSAWPEMRQHDFTLLFYTSGTTGMPKGAPLTHANILLQLDSVISKTDLLRPADRVLLPLPFFHVYPLNIGLFAPFLMGLPIILPRSLTGPEIKRAINEGKVTVVIGVPRLLRSLYQAVEAKFYAHKVVGIIFDFLLSLCWFFHRFFRLKLGRYIFYPVHKQLGPTLRMFTSGGAPLEAPLANKMRALGFDLACGYGLTETSPLLALRMPENNNIAGAGEAISGVEIRIAPVVDEEGKTADEEDGKAPETQEGQGEVQARGPNVFGGYRNLPQKTKEAFTEDGWFKTGDLGYFKGDQLYIVGRASSTIVMEGGEKIQPDDIEDRLAKLPGISEIALLQKDHKLVALVVPDAEAGEADRSKEAIATHLKEAAKGVASYLAITDFAMTDKALPRTNLGKIKRFQLKDMYDSAKAGDKSAKGTAANALKDSSAKTPEDKAGKTPDNSAKASEDISANTSKDNSAGAAKEKSDSSPKKKSDSSPKDGAGGGQDSARDASQSASSGKDQELLQDAAAQKCLDWLKGRFPDQEINLDTSPQLDLGIDSLEWMNLTFELLDQTGVELSEEAISKVSTVRDLLTEVMNAAQGNSGADDGDEEERISPIEDPEGYLSENDKSFVRTNTPHEANSARWLFDLIMSVMRPYECEAIGLDKLPQGQFILTPNHESYIDAFAIIAVLPWARLQKTQWAGWSGIAYGNPLFSYLSRLGQVIPIDAQHALVKSLAMSALALKNGKNLVWFPEGERALHGKMLPFRPGIGMLIEKISVSVVPVYLEGTAQALPPGHYWPTKHKIRVFFGDPVDTKTLLEEGKKIVSSKGYAAEKAHEEQERDANSADSRALKEKEAQKAKAARAKSAKDGDKKKDTGPATPENDKAGKPQATKAKVAAPDKTMTGAEQIAVAIRHRVELMAKQAAEGSNAFSQ